MLLRYLLEVLDLTNDEWLIPKLTGFATSFIHGVCFDKGNDTRNVNDDKFHKTVSSLFKKANTLTDARVLGG